MGLFKSLSYKEWIKTRKTLGILFLLAAAIVAYVFIEITHAIRQEEAVNVWYNFLYMGNGFTKVLMAFPVLAGAALALVQFVPEMVNRRFKLTLHLPYPESSIVASMLMYGYCLLLALFVLMAVILVGELSLLFSKEIIGMLMSQFLPWTVAGLSVYGFTAWVCFEPQWKQRVLNLVMAVGLLSVLFLSQKSGVYLKFCWGFLVLLVASFAFPFYSALRFKHGVQ